MEPVAKLLKAHKLTNVETIDEAGNTVLHLTVENKQFTQEEIIETLVIFLDYGINLSTKNKNNETVFHLAANKRMKNVVQFLLTRKTDIYAALHSLIEDEFKQFQELSTQNGSFNELNSELQRLETDSAKFFEWLASEGFDFDCKHEEGQSALFFAIGCNLQHILPCLLKYTKDINFVDERNKTLLHTFLEKNIEGNRHGINKNWYSKRYAADVVKVLLDRGIPVDAEDKFQLTPIRIAIEEKEDFDIVELLLERSTNVNQKDYAGETLFFTTIKNFVRSRDTETAIYYKKVARALIAKGADVNEPNDSGTRPICHAIEVHSPVLVEFLRNNGADLNVTTENGETLLHFIVHKFASMTEGPAVKIFNMLLSNGCQVNARDNAGNTVLHKAAYYNIVIARKLLEHGVDVNCRNNKMETPLIYLATHSIRDHSEVAELLLERGADVNAKNSEGFTALHGIAFKGKEQRNYNNMLLRILLKHGADFNTRNNIGQTIWNENRFKREKVEDESRVAFDVNMLLKHWIKLDAANLECYTGNAYKDIVNITRFQQFREKCLHEIEKLKKTFIVGHRISIYTLLHANPHSRRLYINSDELQKLIHSPKLEEEFPEYSVLILASYREAIVRKSLLEPAKKAWLELTEIRLPEFCIELIFSFLSNADLFDIVEKD